MEDWLPTLLSASGYNMSQLSDNLDGMDMWSVLSTDRDPIRTSMLHNIDPIEQTWSLRVNNMKLIFGKGTTKGWQNWYPPVSAQFPLPTYMESENNAFSQSDNMAQHDLTLHAELRSALQETAADELFESELRDVLLKIGRDVPTGTPLVIECGPIPANASKNCQVDQKPCLYDIVKDPCEFYNLADQEPEMVKDLMWKLQVHNETAVKPKNTPVDPKGLPIVHGGIWVPWVDLKMTKNGN